MLRLNCATCCYWSSSPGWRYGLDLPARSTGFIPQEDQSFLMVIVQAPRVLRSPIPAHWPTAPGHYLFQSRHCRRLLSHGFQPFRRRFQRGHDVYFNHASDKRRGKGHSTADIVKDLSPKLQSLMFAPNGGLVAMFEPPPSTASAATAASSSCFRTRQEHLADLDRVAHKIVSASRQSKDLTGLLTTFSANDPQVLVTIDREKAKAMSVPLSQITTTLSVFMGSEYINDFDYNNRTYRVFVQADQPFRMTAKDLHNFYVRSDGGQMVRWTTWSQWWRAPVLRSLRTTTFSVRLRLMARPHQVTAPARASQPWIKWPIKT